MSPAPRLYTLGISLLLLSSMSPNVPASQETALLWRQHPPLPDAHGFAGLLAGSSGGALIVAGGTNFPDTPLAEGGKKAWHQSGFALSEDATGWKRLAPLLTPLAHSVALSVEEGIVVAGGSDGCRALAEVWLYQWKEGELQRKPLPALPFGLTMSAGACVDRTLYLAGGLDDSGSNRPLPCFLRLNLNQPEAGWERLESWPGPPRSQAVAASDGERFYLISGVGQNESAEGTPQSVYLADAYAYTPGHGWMKLPSPGYAAVAAPSPAPVDAQGRIYLIGGVDGLSLGKPVGDFTPVSRRIQAFNPRTGKWRAAGFAPVGRVCVTTVFHEGRWFLPSGEIAAGVRSPEVWSLQFTPAP